MRAFVTLLAALACLSTLVTGAQGRQSFPEWLTFNEVGLDGHGSVLSRHDIFPEIFSLSPDHRHLAYVPYLYDGARSNRLWVADVHNSRNRLLVEAQSWITDVAWAPNGRTIAFLVGGKEPQPGTDGVWLVDADGTGAHRIGNPGYDIAWSPDSQWLAADQWDVQRGSSFVSTFSVTTGATRELSPGYLPRWSPGGKFVLVHGPGEMRIVPAAGGPPRTVARGFQGTWSPDGRRIAFLRVGKAGRADSLWIVSSRGGRARRIANSVRSDPYAWSPGSKWIAFQWGAHYCGSTLGIARPDGGPARRLTTASRIITPLGWSRGGRTVLYLAERCSNQ